jgi:ubiquinol-cytochrome c reductase cytochrome b subunit
VVFVYIVFFQRYTLLDPENFIEANPIVTPVHIQPEWYFLFAYAILRRIPRKSGGVLALLLSVLAFYIITLFSLGQLKMKGNRFNPLGQILFIWFLVIFFVLTSLGACPAEGIYLKLGMVYTKNYFV